MICMYVCMYIMILIMLIILVVILIKLTILASWRLDYIVLRNINIHIIYMYVGHILRRPRYHSASAICYILLCVGHM